MTCPAGRPPIMLSPGSATARTAAAITARKSRSPMSARVPARPESLRPGRRFGQGREPLLQAGHDGDSLLLVDEAPGRDFLARAAAALAMPVAGVDPAEVHAGCGDAA